MQPMQITHLKWESDEQIPSTPLSLRTHRQRQQYHSGFFCLAICKSLLTSIIRCILISEMKNMCLRIQEMWFEICLQTHIQKKDKKEMHQNAYRLCILQLIFILWTSEVSLFYCYIVKTLQILFFFLKNWALYFKGCCSPLEYKKLE